MHDLHVMKHIMDCDDDSQRRKSFISKWMLAQLDYSTISFVQWF